MIVIRFQRRKAKLVAMPCDLNSSVLYRNKNFNHSDSPSIQSTLCGRFRNVREKGDNREVLPFIPHTKHSWLKFATTVQCIAMFYILVTCTAFKKGSAAVAKSKSQSRHNLFQFLHSCAMQCNVMQCNAMQCNIM